MRFGATHTAAGRQETLALLARGEVFFLDIPALS
jgi:hypothetical protein